MAEQPIHQCRCALCEKPGPSPAKDLHQAMNYLLSQLNDQQQRLWVGLEAKKCGKDGERGLAQIVGWSEQDIAVARRALEQATLGSGPEAEAKDQEQAPGDRFVKHVPNDKHMPISMAKCRTVSPFSAQAASAKLLSGHRIRHE